MLRISPLRFTLAFIGLSYTIRASNLRKEVSSSGQSEIIEVGSPLFWMFAFISFGLSCFAGVCSGLTIGYMAISKTEMEAWAASDEEEKKKTAKPILEVLKDHHFLLSTLLLANALALEALPIFLDKIVPSYLAIFISTASVVIFGEVLPQSYATGSKKISIGYYFAPFVKALEFIFYPFVKPIVMILDKLVDHDEGKIVLSHEKMKNVLLLHNKKEYGYRPEEIEILQNCLDLRILTVAKAMIPLEKVFMIPANAKIDDNLANDIASNNVSKIPVYEITKENVIGFVKAKNFIQFDINNPQTVKESKIIHQALEINKNENLLDSIDFLKGKKINFAIVVNDARRCVGIITLKQIFERMVLKQFNDNEIRVNVHLNQKVRINPVREQTEQD